MRDVLRIAGFILVFVIAIWSLVALNLGTYKFWGPKFENVRREVFKETRSYNEGKIQDLAKYRLEYERAEDVDKEALASTIRHMFADFNNPEMPYQLKIFLKEIRGY